MYSFNHYNVLFLTNLHSPSKSNTNSRQNLDYILTRLSFTTGHFHTRVLCKERGLYYSLLILGSVISCVVFYGEATNVSVPGQHSGTVICLFIAEMPKTVDLTYYPVS